MKDFNSPWRKIASTIYKKPTDSKIMGSVEIDVTDLEAYISQKRKEGIKITLTHFFMVATARALANEVPELNTYVKRGKILSHTDITATVSVLQANGDMSSVKIKSADKLTLSGSEKVLADAIQENRQGEENKLMKMKDALGNIPWPFRNWIYKIIKTISVDWGIALPFLNVDSSAFGSFVLSNIGTLGLDIGYPALLPSANISMVMMLGSVNKKPWVVNDEIIPRKIIMLSSALDHRVVDASHAGKLFRYYKRMVLNPELLE